MRDILFSLSFVNTMPNRAGQKITKPTVSNAVSAFLFFLCRPIRSSTSDWRWPAWIRSSSQEKFEYKLGFTKSAVMFFGLVAQPNCIEQATIRMYVEIRYDIFGPPKSVWTRRGQTGLLCHTDNKINYTTIDKQHWIVTGHKHVRATVVYLRCS